MTPRRFALPCLLLTLLTLGCGGGGGSSSSSSSGGAKPIDPSGNWTLVASDSQGRNVGMAALFDQVGTTVTANSITAAGNDTMQPACFPFNASFSNGTVQNTDQFSGTINAPFGALTFTTTLNAGGTHAVGTYSGLSASSCANLNPSGTFTADEVPSITGAWTGTLQPCDYNQQTAVCTLKGTSTAIAFNLTQHNDTGNVTGTYQVTNMPGFSTGTMAVDTTLQDFLSGLVWQFTMTDAGGKKYVSNGRLDLQRGFCSGCSAGAGATFERTNNFNAFRLQMSH